jgi:hypothetical protein
MGGGVSDLRGGCLRWDSHHGRRHGIDAKTLAFCAISWMHKNDTFRELAIEMGVSTGVISEAIKLTARGSAIFDAFVPQLISRYVTPVPLPPPGVPDAVGVRAIDHIKEKFDNHPPQPATAPRWRSRSWPTSTRSIGIRRITSTPSRARWIVAPETGPVVHFFVDAVKTRGACHDKTVFLASGPLQLITERIDEDTQEIERSSGRARRRLPPRRRRTTPRRRATSAGGGRMIRSSVYLTGNWSWSHEQVVVREQNCS